MRKIIGEISRGIERTVAWFTAGPDWRTWIAHTLIVVASILAWALVFSLAGEANGEWVGWGWGGGFYLGREEREAGNSYERSDIKGFVDSVLDWVIPMLFGTMVAVWL